MTMSKYQLNYKYANDRKAQSSVEFLIIFAFLMFFLCILGVMSFQKSNLILETQKDIEAENFLKVISDKINMVSIEGSGFSTNLTIFPRIYDSNYTLNINRNRLELNVFGRFYDKFVLTENITGTLKPGVNTLQNINGIIVITN